MKNSKKFLAILFSVVTLLAVFTVAFADASHVSGKTSASEVKVGDTVTLTVSMTNTTVSSIGATVTADSAFEIVSGEWLKSGVIANYDASKNKGAFAAGSATAISGDIFKVTLKAKTAGSSAKNVSVVIIAKNGSDTVFEETVSKSIKAICKTHTFGDYTKTATEHARTCSACGYKETAAHTWDAGKVTTAATCAKEGVKTFTCTTCAQTKTESVAKIAHKWDAGKITTAATCTKEGVKTYTCSGCSTTKTESIAKIAHNYGTYVKVDSTYHKQDCVCGDSIKSKHVLSNGTVTIAATCTSEGTRVYTCQYCDYSKTESIAKTAHTYDNACDSTCNKCGTMRSATHKYGAKWNYDNTNHWVECSVCGDKANQSAHVESNWIVDKAATELAAGTRHTECTTCGKTFKTETLPALKCEHKSTSTIPATEPTCEKAGYSEEVVCDVCKTVITAKKEIPATGHKTEITGAKDATCYEEGFTGDKVCSICNKTVEAGVSIPKTEHEVEYFDAKEATCTEDGSTGTKLCKVCNEIFENATPIAKTGHSYVDGVCSKCGATDPNYQQPGEQTTQKPGEPQAPNEPNDTPNEPDDGISPLVFVIIGAGVALIAGIVVLIIILKRKNEDEDE